MWKELEGLPVTVVENEGWEEGMASSIRKGLERMAEVSPEADGALIMVCDQPHVTADLLKRLVDKQHESGKRMVASRYGDTKGTPALFHHTLFPLLMELKGDRGAGKLIANLPNEVATVEFPEGADDIDTTDDYERLTKR
jgi:molybdenum cofactor cytidylyltransferase